MNRLTLILLIALFPCMISCTGTGGKLPVRQTDLFDTDDTVHVEVFKGKPMSRLAVEVEAHSAAVPFGVEDVFHVGTRHLEDSTKCSFVYVFSLKPESVDTVSATALRYHFSLGRKGRVMLMSAKHPDGVTEALNRLDSRVRKGWL